VRIPGSARCFFILRRRACFVFHSEATKWGCGEVLLVLGRCGWCGTYWSISEFLCMWFLDVLLWYFLLGSFFGLLFFFLFLFFWFVVS